MGIGRDLKEFEGLLGGIGEFLGVCRRDLGFCGGGRGRVSFFFFFLGGIPRVSGSRAVTLGRATCRRGGGVT